MKRYCLIGDKLGHSFSARYFNERFAREGIEASYTLEELSSIEELPRLLQREPELRGFNVTIPYKRAVIPFLDELSYEAQMIGAVNCVKREADGHLVGYNTDVVGLRRALSDFLKELPERALVLGTGGASQAVQFVLTEFGIPFDLISRDPLRGNYTYDNLPVERFQEAKLILNATPVGTYPDVEEAPRLPYAFLTPSHYLFDLVYNPPLTSFLDYGQQRGAHTCNGEGMLIAQAEANAAIWGL